MCCSAAGPCADRSAVDVLHDNVRLPAQGVTVLANKTSVLLFLVYFSTTQEEPEDIISSAASITKTNPANRRDAVIVGVTIFVSLFVVALVSIVLVFRYPEHTQFWADILGTMSGVLAAIQYLPQIYFTWKLGDLKSLSVVTLLIQAPGAFVFALSLALRVGKEGWSTWLVYIVTGILQFVLLGMAINFWSVEKLRQRHEAEASSTEEESEHNGPTTGHDASTDGAADECTALLPKTNQKKKAHGGARRHS